jgi:dihydrofolate reductase/thymidylate synthase
MSASGGFSLVVAMDRNRGIGNKGDLPWPKLKGDLKFFRDITTNPDRSVAELAHGLPHGDAVSRYSEESCNAVLMGRKTWESLPAAYRPLPGRLNGVLSRSEFDAGEDAEVWESLDHALEDLDDMAGVEGVHVIGGAQIYAAALAHPDCTRLYVTEIDAEFPCDTFVPATPDFVPKASSEWREENGVRYRFRRYEKW